MSDKTAIDFKRCDYDECIRKAQMFSDFSAYCFYHYKKVKTYYHNVLFISKEDLQKDEELKTDKLRHLKYLLTHNKEDMK